MQRQFLRSWSLATLLSAWPFAGPAIAKPSPAAATCTSEFDAIASSQISYAVVTKKCHFSGSKAYVVPGDGVTLGSAGGGKVCALFEAPNGARTIGLLPSNAFSKPKGHGGAPKEGYLSMQSLWRTLSQGQAAFFGVGCEQEENDKSRLRSTILYDLSAKVFDPSMAEVIPEGMSCKEVFANIRSMSPLLTLPNGDFSISLRADLVEFAGKIVQSDTFDCSSRCAADGYRITTRTTILSLAGPHLTTSAVGTYGGGVSAADSTAQSIQTIDIRGQKFQLDELLSLKSLNERYAAWLSAHEGPNSNGEPDHASEEVGEPTAITYMTYDAKAKSVDVELTYPNPLATATSWHNAITVFLSGVEVKPQAIPYFESRAKQPLKALNLKSAFYSFE